MKRDVEGQRRKKKLLTIYFLPEKNKVIDRCHLEQVEERHHLWLFPA
jgi:hypothetical protein